MRNARGLTTIETFSPNFNEFLSVVREEAILAGMPLRQFCIHSYCYNFATIGKLLGTFMIS
jgi:hypothetical protein